MTIFLYSNKLIYPVHQFSQVLGGALDERLSQARVSGQTQLKSSDLHFFTTPLNIIICFPESGGVVFYSFVVLQLHGEEGIHLLSFSTICNKSCHKCLSHLIPGIDRSSVKLVESLHCDLSKVGWEKLTHEGVVITRQSHTLLIMTYVGHRVCSAIVCFETLSCVSFGQSSFLYFFRKRRR